MEDYNEEIRMTTDFKENEDEGFGNCSGKV